MPSWDKNGFPATISYSPELWDEMFQEYQIKNWTKFLILLIFLAKIDYTKALTDCIGTNIRKGSLLKLIISADMEFWKADRTGASYDFWLV